MLDPDEVIAYEAWKLNKLTTHPDLSVNAYNTEMGALAVAWDEGYDAGSDRSHHDAPVLTKTDNPHRQPGMRGHTPHAAARVSAIGANETDPDAPYPLLSLDTDTIP